MGRKIISERVQELLELGLVSEGGFAESTGGRMPRKIGFRADRGIVAVAEMNVYHATVVSDGRYDTLYTAHNHQWHTRPAYVDSLAAAAAAGLSSEDAFVATPNPGYGALTAGAADATAWMHIPIS